MHTPGDAACSGCDAWLCVFPADAERLTALSTLAAIVLLMRGSNAPLKFIVFASLPLPTTT
jgi:hypothetical protein